MGSGAMIGLLPELARDYGVSGQQVAWINGLGGALLMAAGAFSAALIPVKVRMPIAYCLVGLTNAATLAVLALGPRRPAVYFTGTVMFLYSIGVSYAFFTGVLLEFMGDSGKSGSARYAIINSLGNVPVAYMSWVDGRGYALLGPARHARNRRGSERGHGLGIAGAFCLQPAAETQGMLNWDLWFLRSPNARNRRSPGQRHPETRR